VRQITVDLPQPIVRIELKGCQLVGNTQIFQEMPTLESGYLWQICPLVLHEENCRTSQVLLYGAILAELEIDLPTQHDELDAEQVQTRMEPSAQTLLGNRTQAGQMIQNETGQMPGKVRNYKILWRFTLVNCTTIPSYIN